jgi:5-methylcytosine-specific restriction endonuclease McrA
MQRWRTANPEKAGARDKANPEQHLERTRAWRRSHPEHVEVDRQAAAKWREENHERHLANALSYRQEHREYYRDAAKRQRALQAGVVVATFARREIWERDEGICQLCFKPVAYEDMHMDHVIPLSAGGPHSPSNVQTTHPVCNNRKYNKLEKALA